ncbi:MAG: IS66 family transposase [Cyanobacteriota bacterium]
MKKNLFQELKPESYCQLSKEELVDIIIEQASVTRELQATIKELKQEIERLRVSLHLDSKNSSKPPSSDLRKKPEHKKFENESESSSPKRKPGGQPGHQGKTRKGFGRVDRFEILRPEFCADCGNTTFLSEPVKIETQQVAQLVSRPIQIVEYHRHTCRCQHCGELKTAQWSPEMIPGQDLGVRLQAFLGWINNYGHLPYEKQQEMLWELGQLEIGVGTLVATNERVEQAIEPSICELSDWVRQTQPNVHVDETPWSVKGLKEWLWVIANSDFCLFQAADTRSRAELEGILGTEYQGVLSSDDYSVYNGYQVAEQQKCLAHLRRHFLKLVKLPGLNNQAIGEVFVSLIDEAFKNYRLFQVSLDNFAYSNWANQFKSKVQSVANDWIGKAGGEAGKLLRSLQNKFHQWWYFLDHPEVPPDNNLAERALRLAVTKRKVSGGSRSMERFKHTANLLTVVQTCRRQERSAIDFFEQALKAQLSHSQYTPSLIPQS